jgi:hypothetical protein
MRDDARGRREAECLRLFVELAEQDAGLHAGSAWGRGRSGARRRLPRSPESCALPRGRRRAVRSGARTSPPGSGPRSRRTARSAPAAGRRTRSRSSCEGRSPGARGPQSRRQSGWSSARAASSSRISSATPVIVPEQCLNRRLRLRVPSVAAALCEPPRFAWVVAGSPRRDDRSTRKGVEWRF